MNAEYTKTANQQLTAFSFLLLGKSGINLDAFLDLTFL
jgi:hypothetical protein